MPIAAQLEHARIDVKPGGAAVMGQPSAEFLAVIPHEFARRHLILSGGFDGNTESLFAAEGAKPQAIYNVGVALGRAVKTAPAPVEVIASAIDRAYERAKIIQESTSSSAAPGDVPQVVVHGSEDVEGDLASAVREAECDVLNTQGKAPTVRLVDLLLFEAIQRGASDVHVQPVRGRTLVRYRLDGALHTVRELPGSLASAVVTRIKVMARLDVAEHRTPQDGRATVTVGGSVRSSSDARSPMPDASPRRVDLRVSTLPSSSGERVVLRLLDPARSPHLLTFSALGMPPAVEKKYLAQASRSSGIVLSTGPTGSGKTTTLYTTLAWICTTNSGTNPGASAVGGSSSPTLPSRGGGGCEFNIMTVEDPVEYDLSGPGLSISQTQVDPKKHVTFATGLKHILRQDTDVIMVGEIRDEETARTAIQASLTGHLVLSTLHTNDAASAVARLLDLGVEPFLVGSSLSAVLAQRLVRTVHEACGGQGCAECLHSGFKGRTGVFELLVVDSTLHDLIVRRASAVEIKAAAVARGMITLREAGSRLVADGITTEAEVSRVISAIEEDPA